jgi:hypothetical protein
MNDISFSNYRKNDVHGISLYPATMIAPVQNKLMLDLFSIDEIKSIYDPYHGSGTALYEAIKININCNIIGCDINPLANLITSVKLKGVSPEIKQDIKFLYELIDKAPDYDFHFKNIDKWFKPDIIDSLKKIKFGISQIKDKRNRLFFWAVFSNIIRKYSNTRSSTYKLHIKEKVNIIKLKDNTIRDFKSQIERDYSKFHLNAPNVKLYKGDTLEVSKCLKDQSVDFTITSPPYGDNSTTVPYGQFSSLALFWIDACDLVLEGWELQNYSRIDYMSLGGHQRNTLNETGVKLLEPYLSKISSHKQKKVIVFFADYFLSLDEICRVTNKYIVMTLGNRTVDNITINLTKITSDYLTYKGFNLVSTLSRDIPNKRIPKLTSSVNNQAVPSMSEEFVIIHSRT